MSTVMFGCSFSKPVIATLVAAPSAPSPAVAKTIVWFAVLGTWAPGLPLPLVLLLVQAARPSTATMAVPMTAVMRPRPCFGHICIWPPLFRNRQRRRPETFIRSPLTSYIRVIDLCYVGVNRKLQGGFAELPRSRGRGVLGVSIGVPPGADQGFLDDLVGAMLVALRELEREPPQSGAVDPPQLVHRLAAGLG